MKVLIVLFTLLVFANAQVNLSSGVYKKLTNIQKLTEQKKYKEALVIIDKTLAKKLKKADKAYILQSKGFIYVSQNKYKKAIKSFEQMNALKVMGEQNYLSTIYNMAQLYMGIKNYQKTIEYLNIWIKKSKKVNAQAYILLGQSYALLEKTKGAIKNINKAISLQITQKKKVPINWYELLFSNYYQVKNYKGAIDTLHIIVKLEPKKKNYWMYLSQIYSLQNQPQKGLSVFEQAYNLGILEEKDTVLFVSFLFQNGLYYKGAQLFEKHLENKTVLSNEKNLKLLFEAYFSAKEYKKSLSVLDSLIAKTKKSKYHLQKARVYNMIHKSDNAIKSYEKALKDKKLKEYSKANLELSYLYHEKGMMDKCKECLQKAKKNKHVKKLAVGFLKQLNIN